MGAMLPEKVAGWVWC